MMKNMGWKNGKGLGARESGITANIRSIFRDVNDNRGRMFFVLCSSSLCVFLAICLNRGNISRIFLDNNNNNNNGYF